MNWYMALEDDWHSHPELRGSPVEVPAAFIAGTKDLVIRMHGGEDAVREVLPTVCARGVEVTMIPGAGHWVQQEAAPQVNETLLRFLTQHRGAFG